jgi:hypothetical protein
MAAGVPNLEFMEADARSLPFAADRFDVVVSRLDAQPRARAGARPRRGVPRAPLCGGPNEIVECRPPVESKPGSGKA